MVYNKKQINGNNGLSFDYKSTFSGIELNLKLIQEEAFEEFILPYLPEELKIRINSVMEFNKKMGMFNLFFSKLNLKLKNVFISKIKERDKYLEEEFLDYIKDYIPILKYSEKYLNLINKKNKKGIDELDKIVTRMNNLITSGLITTKQFLEMSKRIYTIIDGK